MALATVPTDTSGHDLRAMTTAEDRAKQEVDRNVEEEIERKIQQIDTRNETDERGHAAPTAPTLVQDIRISFELWLIGQTLTLGQVGALMRMVQTHANRIQERDGTTRHTFP